MDTVDDDPHPPSRGCDCKRCVEDFEIKDQAPSDGSIYESKSVPPWNDNNVQTALLMGLHGTPEQEAQAREFFKEHMQDKLKG